VSWTSDTILKLFSYLVTLKAHFSYNYRFNVFLHRSFINWHCCRLFTPCLYLLCFNWSQWQFQNSASAQLLQRDRTAQWVSFGQKRKTIFCRHCSQPAKLWNFNLVK